MPAPLSVIIPTLNAADIIGPTLGVLAEGLEAGLVGELIIIDGGSKDGIEEIADQIGARFKVVPACRGGQLAAGAAMANRPWLLFIHADTVLSSDWVTAVHSHLGQPENAGYFRLRFNAAGFAPRFVAGWANLRSRGFGLPYGDQSLLISQRLYQSRGGFPNQPLMEDVALARRLRGNLTLLNAEAVTDSEKFDGRWFRRGAKNIWILLRYFLGTSPEKLADLYRR